MWDNITPAKKIDEKNRCLEEHSLPTAYPIGSMYAIYGNIWGILMVNVTIYSIHGSYGYLAESHVSSGVSWFLFACRNMRFVIPIPRAQSCMNGSLRGKSQSHSKRMAARALKIVFALLWFFWICFFSVCGRFTATRRPKIQLGALGGTFQSEFRQIQNPDVSFPEKKKTYMPNIAKAMCFLLFFVAQRLDPNSSCHIAVQL